MDPTGEAAVTEALRAAIAEGSPANRYSLGERVAEVTRQLKAAGRSVEDILVFLKNVASRSPRSANNDLLRAEMIARAIKTYYHRS